MAIKTALSYTQIGQNLKRFRDQSFPCQEIPFQLLLAIGASSTIVQRYRDGKGTVASYDGLLIKGALAFQCAATDTLVDILGQMKTDERVRKAAPAVLLVSDGETLLGYDPSADESYENQLSHLYLDYSFFTPMWGISKYRGIDENPADVKAAEKMAKLHDEIRRENEFTNESDLHHLNIFMMRLLFCYFAEDTGIFESNLFSESVRKFTQPDASDLSNYLSDAFDVMDVEHRGTETNHSLGHFPYVNGGLFGRKIQVPRLGIKARKLILECGALDWRAINPDIFGSMIQAVVTPELRSGLGMHYTSVPNIMKLIGPLFLDELKEEVEQLEKRFQESKNLQAIGGATQKEYDKVCKSVERACNELLRRIGKMKFFDPACGSGNFLIITYKNVRLLENRILHLIQNTSGAFNLTGLMSIINLNQFYGIELDDFAHEIAILSLWIAEHQMNALFTKEFGVTINALPLKTNSSIIQGNACRVDWNAVCPHTAEEEVFVMGNPPYLGSSIQEDIHKKDMEIVFSEIVGWKKLDYISCWYYLGAKYCTNTRTKYAFVSTNSICQGEQVPLLWSPIFNNNMEINFAVTSFKWCNNAKGQAAVICIIVGLSDKSYSTNINRLINGSSIRLVKGINAYLTEGKNIFVKPHNKSISKLPPILSGSKTNDFGYLMLNDDEKEQIVSIYPQVENLIKKFVGASEFIKGDNRYCFYINNKEKDIAYSIPPLAQRLNMVELLRSQSKKLSTKEKAKTPYLYTEDRFVDSEVLFIPLTSSERREYIPMGYLPKGTIVSNAGYGIYDADIFIFGIVTSKLHNIWNNALSGKMKTDYRYSSTLGYNTFPFPTISEAKKAEIEAAANEVLDCRDYHCGSTLAELYDPDKMPDDLRQAHHRLDLIVESCYQSAPFANDEERLECLFKLYEKMTKKK